MFMLSKWALMEVTSDAVSPAPTPKLTLVSGRGVAVLACAVPGATVIAPLPGFVLPGDVSASSRYFARDVTAPFELADGHLAVPQGPGTGVDVLPDVLEDVTDSVRRLQV